MSFQSEYLFDKRVEPMCPAILADIKATGATYHTSWDGCKFVWVRDGGVVPPVPTPPTVVLSSPQSGSYEVGLSVGPITLNAVVTPGSSPVSSIDFFNGATNIQSGINPVAVDAGPFTTNQTWSATATDGSLTGTSNNTSVSFIYPYFWGVSAVLPVPGQAIINAGNKVVVDSTGTITVNFNSGVSDYVWFAIPQTSTTKTKWYIDVLNNGNIGTPADLFGAESVANVDSPTLLWNNIPYKFYVSNYQTQIVSPMELRNS